MALPASKSLAPNFYQTAAGMSGSQAPGAAGAGAGGSGAGATSAASAGKGEKIANIRALLEVFKKMDSIESDPAAKDIIAQMATLAEKYMTQIEGGAAGAGAGAGAGTGGSGSSLGTGSTLGMSGAGMSTGAGSQAVPA